MAGYPKRHEVAPVFKFECSNQEGPSHLRAGQARDAWKFFEVTSHTVAGWVSLDIREFWTTESGRTMERRAMMTLDKETACRLVDHLSAALRAHL